MGFFRTETMTNEQLDVLVVNNIPMQLYSPQLLKNKSILENKVKNSEESG